MSPGCRAAAASTSHPSLGLCVSRYEHHTTQRSLETGVDRRVLPVHCGVVLSLGSRGGITPKTGDKSPLEAIATASVGLVRRLPRGGVPCYSPGAFRPSSCLSGLVMRACPGMRSHNRGKNELPVGFACVCMPSLATRLGLGLENSSTPGQCHGRRRTSPTQHSHPTPFPPRMCLRYSSHAFFSMPPTLANTSAPRSQQPLHPV